MLTTQLAMQFTSYIEFTLNLVELTMQFYSITSQLASVSTSYNYIASYQINRNVMPIFYSQLTFQINRNLSWWFLLLFTFLTLPHVPCNNFLHTKLKLLFGQPLHNHHSRLTQPCKAVNTLHRTSQPCGNLTRLQLVC